MKVNWRETSAECLWSRASKLATSRQQPLSTRALHGPRQLEHPLNTACGATAEIFVKRDDLVRTRIRQRIAHLLEGIELHVWTQPAAADEVLFRRLHLEATDEAALGEHQVVRGVARLDVLHHRAGAADEVGHGGDFGRAFRMSDDLQTGKANARVSHGGRVKYVVHDAGAIGGDELLVDATALQLGPNVFTHQPV